MNLSSHLYEHYLQLAVVLVPTVLIVIVNLQSYVLVPGQQGLDTLCRELYYILEYCHTFVMTLTIELFNNYDY